MIEQNKFVKSLEKDFTTAVPISDGVVTIRLMSDLDADAYATGADDALVKRFAHLPLGKYTPQVVRDMIRGVIADGLRDRTLAVLAIADTRSDSFLGSLVIFDIKKDEAEIGYWVAPTHRGRGVSRRALILSTEIARIMGLKKLRARTVRENPASEKSLIKAGFSQVSEPQLEETPSGKLEMGICYCLEV